MLLVVLDHKHFMHKFYAAEMKFVDM